MWERSRPSGERTTHEEVDESMQPRSIKALRKACPHSTRSGTNGEAESMARRRVRRSPFFLLFERRTLASHTLVNSRCAARVRCTLPRTRCGSVSSIYRTALSSSSFCATCASRTRVLGGERKQKTQRVKRRVRQSDEKEDDTRARKVRTGARIYCGGSASPCSSLFLSTTCMSVCLRARVGVVWLPEPRCSRLVSRLLLVRMTPAVSSSVRTSTHTHTHTNARAQVNASAGRKEQERVAHYIDPQVALLNSTAELCHEPQPRGKGEKTGRHAVALNRPHTAAAQIKRDTAHTDTYTHARTQMDKTILRRFVDATAG